VPFSLQAPVNSTPQAGCLGASQIGASFAIGKWHLCQACRRLAAGCEQELAAGTGSPWLKHVEAIQIIFNAFNQCLKTNDSAMESIPLKV